MKIARAAALSGIMLSGMTLAKLPPKISPETARQIAFQQRAYREWRAADAPPQAYLHPEDQWRAKVLDLPCKPADLGHGCHALSPDQPGVPTILQRDTPCDVPATNEPGGITSRATEDCYVLGPQRRFRGVWVDEFEGSQFFDGRVSPPAPERFDRSESRQRMEEQRKTRTWLSVNRSMLPRDYRCGRPYRASFLIDFLGRRTPYPGHYGHLGMSGSEIVVDRVIAIRALD